ncbi:MAG: monovalent cation/H(+) antiporter subunit G, partial [Desulfofustis sp.]|nr:monovalent cation/H(+) antiporter subunit G [Desulfofustis sp.]
SLRAATIIFLLLLTTPVAAHLIGRASYLSGVQLSSRTWIDELGASLEHEDRAETAGENGKQPIADKAQ